MPGSILHYCPLLIVATLVASLTQQFTVLFLGHALAALFDYRAH